MSPLPSSLLKRSHQPPAQYDKAQHEEVTINLGFNLGRPGSVSPVHVLDQEQLHSLDVPRGPLVISLKPTLNPEPRTQHHHRRQEQSTTATTSPPRSPLLQAIRQVPYLAPSVVQQANLPVDSLIALILGSLAALLLLLWLLSWLAARRHRRHHLHPAAPPQLPTATATTYHRGPDGDEYYKPPPYTPSLVPALNDSNIAGGGDVVIAQPRSRSSPRSVSRSGHKHRRRLHHRHSYHESKDTIAGGDPNTGNTVPANLEGGSSSSRNNKTGFDYDYAEIPSVVQTVPPAVRTRVAPATRRVIITTTKLSPGEIQGPENV